MDYLIAIDADMMVIQSVGPEILGDLVGTLHPGFLDKPRHHFSYERRPNSTAFLSVVNGTNYFAGGLFGGKRKEFLDLCSNTIECIKQDLANNQTIAKWNDESHLNHYFALVKPPTLILSPAYCKPQSSLFLFAFFCLFIEPYAPFQIKKCPNILQKS